MIRFFSSLAVLCTIIVVFVSTLCLWVFFPPDLSAFRDIKRPAPLDALDVAVGLEACFPPDAIGGGDSQPSDSSVMVLEPVGNAPDEKDITVEPPPPVALLPAPSSSALYFLRVNQIFASEKEAAGYADRVLSEHDVDDCWGGVSGPADSPRFTLLIGPFQTRSEVSRIQSRLTGAKIQTLFVGDRYLHRFRSVVPVSSPQQPAVSSIASVFRDPSTPIIWSGSSHQRPDQFPVLINFVCRRRELSEIV